MENPHVSVGQLLSNFSRMNEQGTCSGDYFFKHRFNIAKAVDAQPWKQKLFPYLQTYVLVHAEVLMAGETAS